MTENQVIIGASGFFSFSMLPLLENHAWYSSFPQLFICARPGFAGVCPVASHRNEPGFVGVCPMARLPDEPGFAGVCPMTVHHDEPGFYRGLPYGGAPR
jgi:hypothetical protein